MWHVAVYCVSGCATPVITVVDDLAAVLREEKGGEEWEGREGEEEGGVRGLATRKNFCRRPPLQITEEIIVILSVERLLLFKTY